ncbi:MAG: ABC transporter permease [Acidobacteriota bacterium]|nr:ABC transporter permease [Acidobacteriota bacterium]
MFRDLLLRTRNLFRRGAVERELDEELNSHFERLVEFHEQQGLSRQDALRQARLEFGGFDQLREEHRDSRGTSRLEAIGRDISYALRQMRRSPGFTLLAVLCLGVGIGVTTAIFGVLNAVFLRPMAVIEPQRLVLIDRAQGEPFAFADYLTLRERSRQLEGITATVPMESDLEVDHKSEIAVAEVVSANYGSVMGVPLTIGQWFNRDDEPSAVISDAVWERKFGRAPDVIGRILASESQTYTVVGVAPAAFGGTFAPMRTDLWVPVRTRPRLFARLEEPKPFGMLMIFGRLHEGVTARQASTELNNSDLQMRRASGEKPSSIVANIVRGQPNRGARALFWPAMPLLGAVVGAILLIACGNVGHLLLARGALRRREFAMRRALGASRARLIQQLLVETVLLALAGAVVGVVLASWTSRILQSTFPASIAVFALHVDLSLDWRALVFTFLVALAASVVSGLLPALRASDVRPGEAFKGQVQSGNIRRRPIGLIAQVVMSSVLMFVTISFLRGVAQLQATEPGFETAGRLYAHTALPSSSANGTRRQEFYRQALDQLRALPGVQHAALTSVLPLIPAGVDCASTLAGVMLQTTASEVGPDYFRTLGIPLIAGQDFTVASLATTYAPVIVSESLGRQAWPNASPIGKQIELGCVDTKQRAVVIGVARDATVRRVGERAQPHIYRQIMREAGGSFTTIVLSASGDPSRLTGTVRDMLARMGQGVRIYEVLPLSVPIEQSFAAPQWLTRVLALFALLALSLAAIGLFGITAYRVSQRTHEIGVRMALGARRRNVFQQVMSEALGTVLIGIVIGEVMSLGARGVAASTFEGVEPAGATTHLIVAAVWIAVAMGACWLPSAWATRVDPVVALRHD